MNYWVGCIIWLSYLSYIYIYIYIYTYIYILKDHNLENLECYKNETPHKQHVKKCQEKTKTVIALGTKKNEPCMLMIFFRKLLHDFGVKTPVSSIKKIEISVIFKLFQMW